MRYVYYFLCPLPTVLQLISWLSPNNWAAGGPSVKFQLVLLALIALSSFVLTFIGGVLVSQAIDGKSKLATRCHDSRRVAGDLSADRQQSGSWMTSEKAIYCEAV